MKESSDDDRPDDAAATQAPPSRWATTRDVAPTLFQGLTALTAVAALLFSAQSLNLTNKSLEETADANRKQRELAEKGQNSERFGRAIDQLGQEGADKLSIRLGGIYALEHVMQDSVADRPTVVEVLCAFVRTHTLPPTKPVRSSVSSPAPVAQDVQAAVVVLGRRAGPDAPGSPGLDLSGAYLRDANLPGANLASAKFAAGAVLAGANLADADLRAANLGGVDLVSAKLARAKLAGADLNDANLTDAKLAGVDLSKTVGLTEDQLKVACLDTETRLPDGVARPSPAPTCS